MEKVVDDTCEPWLNSIMRAPPLPPELVSSLTEQVEKMVSLTENELAGADEANEMHPPLVGVFGEGEGEGRGGGRGEDTAGGGGCGGDVGDVGGVEGEGVCEEGEVEDALAVEGELGDCYGVVPVMVVVLRLREGELSERWKRMGVIWFVELWAMARAETVREPWVCWKRADEADGSGEEDVDNDDKDERDDVDCDDCECEFCG
ncbi:uncharacterized protein MONOS_9416 [Monocercomonoides exilis]|uniref:uncharacterized protein n=1 Tax=Monocercomonoides exilis TaxID=2049356 RepID=UPI00355A4756|nr:hypothetical protein MONOS_9416 [Monocercomonoides exilis]|eukprot:MONOS_9416.1-p1 / transcript=MONOS_9416.1 / gene=MONOS_9416 / organism=Monocercomonoides_exilis_PA203 / gene_product=unspecified product / transcript_product=unspecified product / location=Mono_scaffold00388:33830-34571(+) / protein_length=204 / sequence_SO=supercontig / SO=protein_coding / is_pseudo=false